MGLDMYLSAEKYVQDWSHDHEDGIIPDTTPAKKIASITGVALPVTEVKYRAMYWRKANAIHNWFVNNIQSGEDDCKPYYVTHEQLQELVDVCSAVLANHKLSAELLPPSAGFFFGSTELDDWYFADLTETAEQLQKILFDPELEKLSFYYQSSW